MQLETFEIGFAFFIMCAPTASATTDDQWKKLFLQAQMELKNSHTDKAIELLKEAQSMACSAQRIGDERRCGDTLAAIAWIYSSKGMTADALPYYVKAYPIRLSALGQYHMLTLSLCADYGMALMESEKSEDAQKILEVCAAEKNDVDVMSQVNVYFQLSTALAYQHKFVEGESLIRRLLTKLERRSLQETPEYAGALAALAVSIQKQNGGRFIESIAILRKALLLAEKVYGKDSERYARWEGDLAENLLAVRGLREAEDHARHAYGVIKGEYGDEHPRTAAAASVLGKVLFYEGRYQEVESIYKEVHRVYVNVFGPRNQYLKDAQWYLVQALERQGKDKEARKFERDNKMWVIR